MCSILVAFLFYIVLWYNRVLRRKTKNRWVCVSEWSEVTLTMIKWEKLIFWNQKHKRHLESTWDLTAETILTMSSSWRNEHAYNTAFFSFPFPSLFWYSVNSVVCFALFSKSYLSPLFSYSFAYLNVLQHAYHVDFITNRIASSKEKTSKKTYRKAKNTRIKSHWVEARSDGM